MKTLVTGAWRQDGKEWLELTQPFMKNYARLHGYDFEVSPPPTTKFDKHPSWYKLNVIECILQHNSYDPVVWIDADIVIVDPSKDILDEVPYNSDTACVFHRSITHGVTPCIGVWPVFSLKLIQNIMRYEGTLKLPGLRELEPFAMLLGGTQKWPMEFPNGIPKWCAELDYRWNEKELPYDVRDTTDDIRFFHATGIAHRETRIELIKKWVKKAEDR